MTILHLEDSENDAVMIESVLLDEWPGCRIHRVASRGEYESALEFGNFDLILSDHSLPGFDGVTALEFARTRRPEKPFIFLSGTIGEERAVNALLRGAADYVIKDRPGRLVPAIRRALERVEESVRQRRTEEALRESQARFRQITENVADMISVHDSEGYRLYQNPACGAVVGTTILPRGGDPFGEIHPDDRERVRALFAETVRTGLGRHYEYRLLLPGDRVCYIEAHDSVLCDAAGRVANVLVVSRDVTARRRADERLREQAALLDKARDAIFATDLDHRVTYWNTGAERLYGWSLADVVGRRLVELDLGYDPARFAAAHGQLLATGGWSGDFRVRNKAGDTLQIESSWSLVRGADGEPRSILFIGTDVTERKKLEAQVLRADRIDSLGMLAGGVAHDLNNVLAPILMGTELLRMGLADERSRRLFEAIETSARHGAALVRQLLVFARGGDGEQIETHLPSLVEDLPKLLRQSLPRNIKFTVTSAASAWPILADATQIKQLLINLCLNARDAMPQGGTLDVVVENTTVDANLARQHPRAQPGPHLLVSVRDTGTGIPPALLEKIFDPFFTTKSGSRGTGLGLSTVAGIVKNHGGFLQVESEVGRGTVFRFFFPALLQAPAAPVPPSPAPADAGHGETLLVVDDDEGVRETLRLLLEKSGYAVAAVADGAAGLAEFEHRRGQIAAVVLDMMMPGLKGPQVIAALRACDPSVPIVAVSGYFGAEEIMPDFDRRTVAATLAKPIDLPQLLRVLRGVITGKAPSP